MLIVQQELLDLSDKIGYVGTGLQEEEISNCLRKFKHFNRDSTSLLITGHKDWKCSICQVSFAILLSLSNFFPPLVDISSIENCALYTQVQILCSTFSISLCILLFGCMTCLYLNIQQFNTFISKYSVIHV